MGFRSAYDHGYERSYREYPKTSPEYRKEFNPDTGQYELVEVGQVNLYELKQEAAKDCSIYKQIDRFNRTGDASFLGQTVDGFIDTLSMPKSLMEMENIRAKCSQLWSQAPKEIKDRYGTNINLFLKDVDEKLKDRAAAKQSAARAAVKEGGNNA